MVIMMVMIMMVFMMMMGVVLMFYCSQKPFIKVFENHKTDYLLLHCLQRCMSSVWLNRNWTTSNFCSAMNVAAWTALRRIPRPRFTQQPRLTTWNTNTNMKYQWKSSNQWRTYVRYNIFNAYLWFCYLNDQNLARSPLQRPSHLQQWW